jgi:hypothetical protein
MFGLEAVVGFEVDVCATSEPLQMKQPRKISADREFFLIKSIGI